MNKGNKNIMMLYENTMQQPTMTVDGKRYREDGCAFEYPNGAKVWSLHGKYHSKYHREDGPAYEYANGDKEWYLHGKYHREDGPAVEYVNGNKEWWLHGKQHREDGPAVEYANGNKSWYVNGIKYENIFTWAKALLKMKGINDPSEDEINDKMQQVTSSSILD